MKPSLDKKLGKYIEKHLNRGHSKEAIAKVLLNHGYDGKYVKQLLTKHALPHPALNLLPVIAIFLIMFGFAWFVFQPGIVSYVTVEQTTAYNQTVHLSIDRNTERTWLPEHVGPLTSIALTGSISTSGTARIYLEYNNLTYLIFNSAMLNASNSNLITGYVVLENLTDSNNNENLTNAQSNNESEELNESSDNENINQSESIPQTQPVNESVEPISKSININLIYNSGSAWDANDDGKEPLDGVIDLTVNNSELTAITDETSLCTRWTVKSLETLSEQNICNGNEECCNFLNLNQLGTEWNEPFLLTYQKYNSTENNEISAQIIYYNVNLTSLEAEIINSEKATLSAKFKSDVIEFTNACHENCLLNNLNASSYKLIFEIDNAQLNIDTIKYSILERFIVNETLEENLTNILEEKTIQYQAVINKPVKWKKTIKLNETQSNITIELPKEATNINVTKKVENESIEIENVRVKTRDYETSVNIYNAITGNVVVTIEPDSFLSKLLSSFRGITGYAVLEPSNATELLIEEAVKDIEIEYETEAPRATEQNITENKKRITVTSNVHYENILTFTELPKEAPSEAVKLYWLINNSRIEVNIDKYDTNENNLVDYIEWVTPYLSNQTYELEITVLDVQSYPTVGSTWTVRFNTTGASNLTITAVGDTTYSEMFDDNALTEDDLELKELKCGDEVIFNKDNLNASDNLYFILEDNSKVKLYETYTQSYREF